MLKYFIYATTFLAVLSVGLGENPQLSIDKGVIVHLFEWRWEDIALECEEFLAPYGYTGVQISPPNENRVAEGRPWWERYQPVSYHLHTRSGTEEQLKDMLARCNRVGIRIFADVVINHMTGLDPHCHGTDDSKCFPDTYKYPAVPYSHEHFHHFDCSINYRDAWSIQNCEMDQLRDLDQANEYVRDKIVEYLDKLIDIGIAGFRVDAARHMDAKDLKVIYDKLKNLNTAHGFPENTKPLIYQEVIDMRNEVVTYQMYQDMGLVTDMRYGKELGPCFQGRNNLEYLENFAGGWDVLPDNVGVVCIENHDTERGKDNDILNYKNSRSYKMAVSYMLARGWGTPQILSGYDFKEFFDGPPHEPEPVWSIRSPRPINNHICSNGWICQHRWRQIYNMVAFHNVVRGAKFQKFWKHGSNQIAFCRGNMGFVAFNLEKFPLNQTIQTCLPRGVYCDVISGNLENGRCTGKYVHVNEDGTAHIFIDNFNSPHPDHEGVLAIHIKAASSLW